MCSFRITKSRPGSARQGRRMDHEPILIGHLQDRNVEEVFDIFFDTQFFTGDPMQSNSPSKEEVEEAEAILDSFNLRGDELESSVPVFGKIVAAWAKAWMESELCLIGEVVMRASDGKSYEVLVRYQLPGKNGLSFSPRYPTLKDLLLASTRGRLLEPSLRKCLWVLVAIESANEKCLAFNAAGETREARRYARIEMKSRNALAILTGAVPGAWNARARDVSRFMADAFNDEEDGEE